MLTQSAMLGLQYYVGVLYWDYNVNKELCAGTMLLTHRAILGLRY